MARKSFFIAAAFLLAALLAACSRNDEPAATGTVQLQFNHVVGTEPLRLNTTEYTNPAGEPFRVRMFKYYVSNIRLRRADGTEYAEPESYHLIDESLTDSKTVTLRNVPAGEYTAVRFVIGVDSVRNFSGAQTGALDPLNGMLWDWNTGYIFMKFEGTSAASPASDRAVVYHIGGFRNPNNIRSAAPPLNGTLPVTVGKTTALTYHTDVRELFGTPNLIRFSETPTLMFDPRTAQMADNYADMFTVTAITTLP